MKHAIPHLENALQNWEDWALYDRAMLALSQAGLVTDPISYQKNEPVFHAQRLRAELLNSNEAELPDEFTYNLGASSQQLNRNTIPDFIWSWTRASRRVFRISEELQTLLLMSSLEGVAWNEISWPFKSFGIWLEQPIFKADGVACDFILIDTKQMSATTDCKMGYIFSDQGRPLFDQFTRSKIQTHLKKKNWRKLLSVMKAIHEREPNQPGIVAHIPIIPSSEGLITTDISQLLLNHIQNKEEEGIYVINEDDDAADKKQQPQPVQAILDQMNGQDLGKEKDPDSDHEHWQFVNLCAGLVAGLCLYLSTLPPGSSHRSEWTSIKKPSKPDPRAIADKALVCEVRSTYVLEADERAIVHELRRKKRAVYELCSHYRRGHWRRPPGKGSDPNAPRTIWVRPAWIRKDRLKPGEIPGGNLSETY